MIRKRSTTRRRRAAKMAEAPTEQLGPDNQPISDTSSKDIPSSNHSLDQPTDHSLDQPTDHSLDQPTDHPLTSDVSMHVTPVETEIGTHNHQDGQSNSTKKEGDQSPAVEPLLIDREPCSTDGTDSTDKNGIREDSTENDEVNIVEAVVDRRAPESDHPQPITPMEFVAQQLGESFPHDMENNARHGLKRDTGQPSSEREDTQSTTSPQRNIQDADQTVTIEAITVDAQETEDDSTPSLDSRQDQANAELEDLAQKLTVAQEQSTALQRQVSQLNEELERSQTQVSQLQSQLKTQTIDQNNDQQSIQALTENITTLKQELEEAKRYILQLTEAQSGNASQPSVSSPQSSVSSPQSSVPSPQSSVSPPQSSPFIPPTKRPVAPSYRGPKPLAARSTGLPPMSTEQLGERSIAAASARSRPAYTRPAYTRPGFSNPPAHSGQPNRVMPHLESRSRGATSSESVSESGIMPPSPSSSAMVPQRRAPLASRRSRYDELKPKLKSPDLPQPKVSDAEIGWFD